MKKSTQILAALLSAALLTGAPAIARADECGTIRGVSRMNGVGVEEIVRLSSNQGLAVPKTTSPRDTGRLCGTSVLTTSKTPDSRIVGYTRGVGTAENDAETTRMDVARSRWRTIDTENTVPFTMVCPQHF